jgi:hypothetical protein
MSKTRVVKVLPELAGHKSAPGSLDIGQDSIEQLLASYRNVYKPVADTDGRKESDK